ncbi:fatty acid transporter protein [Paracoccidioides lutzii Pb01]|uniref:Very long-chain fatty acid transport protein n=1 Tax=Paracoccidioides lutzii (strain ATCC MYA-826 / Pb01) TaxID=502779 RepID=C1H6L5_PARBA|nr:fatty acid transporter protein [Paracoccidioides lutzii Pb01]EEH35359.1 fatty acid transporter protein [Paracoccidioides lutzii Pb01]
MAVAAIPLSLAVPAAVASAAYLNARWGVSDDLNIISSLTRAAFGCAMAERRGECNLFYIVERNALNKRTANNLALIYDNQEWTFHELYTTTLRYGAWLKNTHSIKVGDVIALDFMNSAAFIFMWMGLWSIGATPAFINYNLTKSSLTHCVKASTAHILFAERELQQHLFPPEQLEVFGQPDFREGGGPVQMVFYDKALEREILQTPGERTPDSSRPGTISSETAVLIYTSGTTGLPKPAIVSWHKCIMGGKFVSNWVGLKTSDRVYTCMPLYHSTAAVLGYVACMFSASTIIIGRKFSARKFWKEVRANEATIVQYVGETLRYLIAVPPEIDPATGENLDINHKVRLIYGNGLRPDVWNRVKERFNVPTVCEFYASTEGNSGSWNRSNNDFTAGAIGKYGTITRLILGRRVAVVELDYETEQPLRDPKTGFCKKVSWGEPGELLFALDPDNIKRTFQGYFNNSKATESKIMRGVLKKGDAWFRTGDVVRWDADGRWYFSDRIGDTFRWRSENVSTNEVSEVLGKHLNVLEANVYGVTVPHHDGRAGCAAIVFREQAAVTPPLGSDEKLASEVPILEPTSAVLDSLAQFAADNLPKYAVPTFLRVTREMQSTGNNKQQKLVLRNEGIDVEFLNGKGVDDRLYWLREGRYLPFGLKEWGSLKGGQVKL